MLKTRVGYNFFRGVLCPIGRSRFQHSTALKHLGQIISLRMCFAFLCIAAACLILSRPVSAADDKIYLFNGDHNKTNGLPQIDIRASIVLSDPVIVERSASGLSHVAWSLESIKVVRTWITHIDGIEVQSFLSKGADAKNVKKYYFQPGQHRLRFMYSMQGKCVKVVEGIGSEIKGGFRGIDQSSIAHIRLGFEVLCEQFLNNPVELSVEFRTGDQIELSTVNGYGTLRIELTRNKERLAFASPSSNELTVRKLKDD